MLRERNLALLGERYVRPVVKRTTYQLPGNVKVELFMLCKMAVPQTHL